MSGQTRDRKYERQSMESELKGMQSSYNSFINPIQGNMPGLVDRGNKERSDLISGYKNIVNGPSEGSAAGGFAVPNFEKERGYLTGFADTGGYSDKDVQRIHAQAASSSPAFFDALKNQYRRSNVISNQGPSAGLDVKMARQAAQAQAGDKLNANIGLAESQRAGKQFGISGLVDTASQTGQMGLQRASLIDNYNSRRGDNQLNALNSMQSLYGTDYAPVNSARSSWLAALGQLGNYQLGNRSNSLENNKNRLANTVGQTIGAIGGVLPSIPGLG